jgi:hypothetical protein
MRTRVWSAAVTALRSMITLRGPGRGTPFRMAVSWAAIALLGGACLAPGPPARSFPAEVLGLGASWDFGECAHKLVTLRSGATLDILEAGVRGAGCPEEEPTTFLFGHGVGVTSDPPWEDLEAPLFLTGLDGEERWLAVAVGQPDLGCWMFDLGDDEHAFLEGRSLHLSNGLLLPLADDYVEPTAPFDGFPLLPEDRICLDADGQVTTAFATYRGPV